MRTTIDIDKPLLAELKRIAAREKKTLGRVVGELLVDALPRRRQPPVARWRWPVHDMGAPRIDLHDGDALWLLLDRDKADAG